MTSFYPISVQRDSDWSKEGHGTQFGPMSHLHDLCLCHRERNTIFPWDHLVETLGEPKAVSGYLCYHMDIA